MRRPRSTTVVCIILAGLALFNVSGAVGAYQRADFIRSLPLAVPAAYLLVSRAVWAAAWAGLAFGLWRRQGWARAGGLLGYGLWLAQTWIERLVLAQADYAAISLGWAALIDGLGLGLILWALVWRWPPDQR